MYKILLVDDENLSRDMLATYIEGLLGHKVVQARSGEEAYSIYENEEISIVLSDIKMPGMNGIDLLRAVKAHPNGKKTKVVLFTGFAQVETAVQALRDGAFDYLFKPIDVNKLTEILEKIISEIETTKDFDDSIYHSISDDSTPGYIKNGAYVDIPDTGRIGVFSKKMKEIVKICEKLHADRSIPVLIEGPSGSGKEVIARLIHHGSEGFDKPFMSINCAAISPTLFESELFGYDSGSFTGGNTKGKIGLLEMAQGGTIVLDEIGEMPLDMQPKLLHVLQERFFYRVGGTKKIELNVRFIASTNKNLKKLVQEEKFRYDLYYRLNSAYLDLPGLAEHKESIAPLAQMFLVDFSEKKDKLFRLISKEAVDILEAYPWNGNIRELHNVMERVVLLHNEIELRPEHLSFLEFESDKEFSDKLPTLSAGGFKLPDTELDLDELEKTIVEQALKKFNGNKTQTAKYLGLTISALRSRLK